MKNTNKKSTYGSPLKTSLLLIIYSFAWLGVLTFLAATMYRCEFVWSGLIWLPAWLLATIILLVMSIVIIQRYTRRIRNLRALKQKIPKSYFLVFIMIPVALSSIFWALPIASQVDTLTSDASMNSIEEFKDLARECKIESVENFYNDNNHRATDASAYTRVTSYDYDVLYYSYDQRSELETVYNNYMNKCTEKFLEVQATSSDSQIYRTFYWNDQIEDFMESC